MTETVEQCQETDGTASSADLTVFYDGACPLCSREIAFYRREIPGEEIEWIDVAAPGFDGAVHDIAREDAIARFHVRRDDGSLAVGVDAFRELWMRTPAMRWLAFISRPRPVRWLLSRAYEVFLFVRRRAGLGASAA